ncbi:MAG: hypothetical protein ACREES_00720 [Stellaceae bacterium]
MRAAMSSSLSRSFAGVSAVEVVGRVPPNGPHEPPRWPIAGPPIGAIDGSIGGGAIHEPRESQRFPITRTPRFPGVSVAM